MVAPPYVTSDNRVPYVSSANIAHQNKVKKQEKIATTDCLFKVARHYGKKWASENQHLKEFGTNPEDCFEAVRAQRNRFRGFMICLAIFIASLTAFICTMFEITTFVEVSLKTGFWIFLGSIIPGIASALVGFCFFEGLQDNRLGKTTKKLAKDWAPIRKRIIDQKNLLRSIKNDKEGRWIELCILLSIFNSILSSNGQEVRKAEIEGKLWIKNRVRPQMSEIYDIGNELGLKQPKFETYFIKS